MTYIDPEVMYRNLLTKLADIYQEWENLDAVVMADWHPKDAIDRCLMNLNGILANHLLLCPECDAPTTHETDGVYQPCGHRVPAPTPAPPLGSKP